VNGGDAWEAFAVSAGAVALGEIGDKTQLLALLLAARYHKPVPIILGILVATLANHAGAAALGSWVSGLLDPTWLRWILGASFLAVAVWMLIPDQADDVDARALNRFGVFGVTVLAFFLAEMGDKTQIATVMLAAKYPSLVAVTAGTTLGMMLANVPAVLLGDRVVRAVPVVWVHRIAAGIFALLGLLVLLGFGG
jgi:Ca2+/H+ antiporter, TMEM165/GDT1 family